MLGSDLDRLGHGGVSDDGGVTLERQADPAPHVGEVSDRAPRRADGASDATTAAFDVVGTEIVHVQDDGGPRSAGAVHRTSKAAELGRLQRSTR